MLTRGGEDDRRRDEQRDVERDQRVQQRYGRFFEEEEINSVEEEDQAVKPGSSTSSEEIVEIEAPQLKTKPKPLCSFEDESIPDFVKQVVRHMGFTQPTIIQKYCKTMLLLAIPIALLGCDMIAIAKTGSGKTFSYMIPCLMKVASVRRQIPHHRSMNGFFQFFPLGLILAPTRELAIQIYDSSMMLAVRSGLKLSVVYGGAKKDCQLGEMSDGVDVLIATPGRLIDFLNCGSINLSTVQFFVLDEADRMLVSSFNSRIWVFILR